MEAICASDAPWIAPTDQPLLAELAGVLNGLAYTRPWLEEHGYLDRRGAPRAAAKLYLRQVRLAGELAHRLGLTPQARVKLGLKAAQTTEIAAKQPVRSEERAMAVAKLLQRSGALPQIEDAEVEPREVDVIDAEPAEPEETPRPPLKSPRPHGRRKPE